MRELKQEIYRVDRFWFNLKAKRTVGDMYFTFQVADDSRTTDINQLILNVKDNVRDNEIGEFYDMNDEESVPIYTFQKATATLKVEDDEDVTPYYERLDIWDIDDGWKDVYSFAVCTKDYAEKIGLNYEIDEFFC